MTNNGLVVPIGTVDNGYRGDIGVVVFNHSFRYHVIRNGDRIAQLVVCPVAYPTVIEVEELTETERGADGFGSTGV
jgi:dUTP pyrophosphatase